MKQLYLQRDDYYTTTNELLGNGDAIAGVGIFRKHIQFRKRNRLEIFTNAQLA